MFKVNRSPITHSQASITPYTGPTDSQVTDRRPKTTHPHDGSSESSLPWWANFLSVSYVRGKKKIDDARTTTEANAKIVWWLTTISAFLQIHGTSVCVRIHARRVLPVIRLDEIGHGWQVDGLYFGIYLSVSNSNIFTLPREKN